MTKEQKEALVAKWVEFIEKYQIDAKVNLGIVDLKKHVSEAINAYEIAQERMKPFDELNAHYDSIATQNRYMKTREKGFQPIQSRMVRYYYQDHNDTFNDMFLDYVNTEDGRKLWNAHIMKTAVDLFDKEVLVSNDISQVINRYGDSKAYNSMWLFGIGDGDKSRPKDVDDYIAANTSAIQNINVAQGLMKSVMHSPASAVIASLKLTPEELMNFLDRVDDPEVRENKNLAYIPNLLPVMGNVKVERTLSQMQVDPKEALKDILDLDKKPVIIERLPDNKINRKEVTKFQLLSQLERGPVEYEMVDDPKALRMHQYLQNADLFQQVYDDMKVAAQEIEQEAKACRRSAGVLQGARKVTMQRHQHWYRGSSADYKAIETGLEGMEAKLNEIDVAHASVEELNSLKADYERLIADANRYVEARSDRENLEGGYQKNRYDNVKAVKEILETELQHVNNIINTRNRVEELKTQKPVDMEFPEVRELLNLTEIVLDNYLEETEKMGQALELSKPDVAAEVKKVVTLLKDPEQKMKVIDTLSKTDFMKEVQEDSLSFMADTKKLHKRVAQELNKVVAVQKNEKVQAPAAEKNVAQDAPKNEPEKKSIQQNPVMPK